MSICCRVIQSLVITHTHTHTQLITYTHPHRHTYRHKESENPHNKLRVYPISSSLHFILKTRWQPKRRQKP